jgi:hypothetical protein
MRTMRSLSSAVSSEMTFITLTGLKLHPSKYMELKLNTADFVILYVYFHYRVTLIVYVCLFTTS